VEERDLARELDELRALTRYQSSLLVLAMQALDGLAHVVRQMPGQPYDTRTRLLKAEAVERELHHMPAEFHGITPRNSRPHHHVQSNGAPVS
jgi:hypothetical protein